MDHNSNRKMMLKQKLHILNKEFYRYLIAGTSTTILNIAIYTALVFFDMRYYLANLITLIITKIYAYYINKQFVYHSYCPTKKAMFFEALRFYVCRIGTGIFDYFFVIISVEFFDFSKLYSKYFAITIVILLNYYLGKKVIFKKATTNEIHTEN